MMIISILICVYVLRDICSLCCLRDAALLRTLVNYELYFVISYFFIIVLYFIPLTTCRAQIPEPLGPTRCRHCLCLFLVLLSITTILVKIECGACNISSPTIFLLVVVFFVVIYLFVDAAKFKIANASATHVHSRYRCLCTNQDSILSS